MINKETNDLGKFLRRIRLDRNEYQQEMADKLGTTPQYLSRVELGRRTASQTFINKLIDVYELTAREQKELDKALFNSYPKMTLSYSKPLSAKQIDLVLCLKEKLPNLNNDVCGKLIATIEGA